MPGDEPSTGFPNGHLGYLTPLQQEALAAFKTDLTKVEAYKPPTGGNPAASHDDPTLLRFLRARGWNASAAQKQFIEAETWRRHHHVDHLYATFDETEFESAKRFYPRWTGRRDKRGVEDFRPASTRCMLGKMGLLSAAPSHGDANAQNGIPLYVYRLASLSSVQKELDAVTPARRYQRIVALYELMTRFTFPLCTHLPHPQSPTPITSTTAIIDLKGVSFGSMWGLRNHLQEASHLATANYPETLGTIAVVNSPSFFPTVWGWIKGWFDEGTRSKIHVLGKDPGPKLRELVHADDLPKAYGGNFEWVYEDEPCLDDAAAELIQAMPKGPVLFVDGEVAIPEEVIVSG